MSKLPAFQFYPADWRKDPGVQSLSWADRGVWIEILCLMHESPRRGVLLMPSGAPMVSVSLARIIGLPVKETIKCLERLVESGVASREADSGALFNRRMVRDESIRYVRTEAGRLGGNPNLLKQNSTKEPTKPEEDGNQDDKQKSTPSSSSSSSTSVEEKKKDSPSENPKKNPTAPPVEFEITEGMRAWAVLQGFDDATVARETEAMLDHYRGNGKRKHDWAATWRNWLRNSVKFGGSRGNGNHQKASAAAANLAAAQDFVSRRLAQTLQPNLPDVRENDG